MTPKTITDGGWEKEFDKIANIETNDFTEGGTAICNMDIKFAQIKSFFRTKISEAVERKLEEAAKACEASRDTLADYDEEMGSKDIIRMHRIGVRNGFNAGINHAAQIIRSLKDTSHTLPEYLNDWREKNMPDLDLEAPLIKNGKVDTSHTEKKCCEKCWVTGINTDDNEFVPYRNGFLTKQR